MTTYELYKGLNNGKRYILRKELDIKRSLFDNKQLRYFVPTANLYLTNGYIGWHHYGSGANKNTMGDLQWVINVIFDGDNDFVDMEEADKDERCGIDNLRIVC